LWIGPGRLAPQAELHAIDDADQYATKREKVNPAAERPRP
jgi:hypothetical protein